MRLLLGIPVSAPTKATHFWPTDSIAFRPVIGGSLETMGERDPIDGAVTRG